MLLNGIKERIKVLGSADEWRANNVHILFADTKPIRIADDHPEVQRYQGKDHYWKGPWLWIMVEQLINSALVGGIVFLTTLGPGDELEWVPAAKGFGITFLFELRKYRQVIKQS